MEHIFNEAYAFAMRPVTLLLKMYSPKFCQRSFALLDAAVGGISDVLVRVLFAGELGLLVHKLLQVKLEHGCPDDTPGPGILHGMESIAP